MIQEDEKVNIKQEVFFLQYLINEGNKMKKYDPEITHDLFANAKERAKNFSKKYTNSQEFKEFDIKEKSELINYLFDEGNKMREQELEIALSLFTIAKNSAAFLQKDNLVSYSYYLKGYALYEAGLKYIDKDIGVRLESFGIVRSIVTESDIIICSPSQEELSYSEDEKAEKFTGLINRAEKKYDLAIRLSPFSQAACFSWQGKAKISTIKGEITKAGKQMKKSLQILPEDTNGTRLFKRFQRFL